MGDKTLKTKYNFASQYGVLLTNDSIKPKNRFTTTSLEFLHGNSAHLIHHQT